MLKNAHACRRLILPLGLALLLMSLLVPVSQAAAHSASHGKHYKLVGPKSHYLALGDSLGFGFQPDFNFDNGYVDDFYANLQRHGTNELANMSCPGETSVTFLNGKCPYPFLRKYPYLGSQLNAALNYLQHNAGTVSPVTLDIGGNDIRGDINSSNCSINQQQFQTDLATLDANLTKVILPQLHAALLVNGQITGDLVLMNYYDPYQNVCPDSLPLSQALNQHLANDVSGYGIIVDVFSAFGGSKVPNPNICNYTWMCSFFHDIHATDKGYSVIANTFEKGTGY